MTTEAAYSSREFDTHSTSHASHSSESKFNVVLFGVQECPSGMSKSARFESDLSNTVGVLSSIDSSIQPQSIRDCFRLGKFSPRASRPRPILTSIKNHFYKMKRDIGMADYEKQVKQEFHTPSLYLCFVIGA